MAKHHRRVIAAVSASMQRHLFRRFLPESRIPHAEMKPYCRHLTYAYKVEKDYAFPTDPVLIEVLGVYHDPLASILICCVGLPRSDGAAGYDYRLLRPDGDVFHITLAVHLHLAPRAGADRVALANVRWLRRQFGVEEIFTPVVFNSRFRMASLQVDPPQFHARTVLDGTA